MRKLSFKIIVAIFTFLVGFSAVLFCIYYSQKEFIEIAEIEPVALIDNNFVKQESFPGLSEEVSKLRSRFQSKENRSKYKTSGFFLNDWYGSFLKSMGEESLLKDSKDTEVYRFLWLRTFDYPIFVRVEKRNDSIKLFSKEMDGDARYVTGKVLRKVNKNLDVAQWNEFLSLLEKSQYWQMPMNGATGRDGSNWILEGVRDNRYHIVDRWSPENGEYREACIYLLKLSSMDDDRLKRELY